MNPRAEPTTPSPAPPAAERRVRGLVFDMDGVLCDSEELMAEAACRMFEDTPPGIAAALASGARCLALTTTFPPGHIATLGAHWIVPDLARLPPDFVQACGLTGHGAV